MGGVDKGLQAFRGKRLVDHVYERLAPQVGGIIINANQNQEAYRTFGVRVVSDAIAGFVPPVESRKKAWESLQALIDTFDACMKSGALPSSNPTAAARLLWAAMHGAVSLELNGYYLKTERADELFDAAVMAVLRSLQMGPIDTTCQPA